MESYRSREILLRMIQATRTIPETDHLTPPWLFKHQSLTEALESARPVSRKALTNTLNYIHFMGGYVLTLLRHPAYEENLLARASLEPCLGDELICRWSDEDLASLDPEDCEFQHLIIADGQSMIFVPAKLKEIDSRRAIIQLPERSYSVGRRQSRRYVCRDVVAELIQSGFLAKGELLDFSPKGIRVRVKPVKSCSFRWFNRDELSTIHLRNEKEFLFSGPCCCLREQGGLEEREIVLRTLDEKISRYNKKKVRNPRQHLLPQPTLHFVHPFLKRWVQLQVSNISTSGLCVSQKLDEAFLIPGLIIPELTIKFAGASKIKCNAQVIYQLEEGKTNFRYGLAILDMAINEYGRLTHILTNALDPHFHTSSDVDMEALWEFFFESGFLYPTKYHFIQAYKDEFKETYRKIYEKGSDIARHFTYRRNGQIYGHICVVRAYERAWLIQHHSSRAMNNKRTGFLVLKQIMHYLNDMYRLPAAKMDYAMTYFRPENKIPDRIFGGFTKNLNNLQGSSLELFCYLPYTRSSLGARLPEGWSLKNSKASEIWEINQFYNRYSGGLLLEALNLAGGFSGEESVEEDYRRTGFFRKLSTYSLLHEGELAAILIAEKSDMGLNLSELLNCIKVLVTEPERLPWRVLSIAVSQLASEYPTDRVPVLLYPLEYAEAGSIHFEKRYQLWILDVQYANEYMEYMNRRFRITYE